MEFLASVTPQDFAIIGFLVFLEGILSIDNALVLALLAKRLPKEKQQKALSYGLVGAFIFRFVAIGLAAYLIKLNWVKYAGGSYLIFISLKSLLFGEKKDEHKETNTASFWKVILLVEVTDIAFAIDSILAAVALTPKFWIVFTGGFLGVLLMRFAASYFIRLLDQFPNFEKTAYLLILWIGIKLILEGFHLPGLDFHDTSSPAFFGFWGLMAATILFGFYRKKQL
ncbi:MAG: hypothetical protein CL678_12375 [Bdellovibrionaceae bacterium]|nr:hypothetical protein [Pseudobdellovibrionaceae bacterium]|tara:strand:+ start:2101 stop:2778 length:678 start_codon:yes stop_codon:yes gene_type:complete